MTRVCKVLNPAAVGVMPTPLEGQKLHEQCGYQMKFVTPCQFAHWRKFYLRVLRVCSGNRCWAHAKLRHYWYRLDWVVSGKTFLFLVNFSSFLKALDTFLKVFFILRSLTRYCAAKWYVPTDGSSAGAYGWCSYMAIASEAALATASLLFRPLLVAVWPRWLLVQFLAWGFLLLF